MRTCISNRDRCATPRAGTLDCVDAILPWRVVDDPLPPPLPPKVEVWARSPAAEGASTTTTTSRAAEEVPPKRVTPWLHRRVKTPQPQDAAQVTRTRHHHRLPEKASSGPDVNVKGSSKPPSYQHQQQQQPLHVRPSEESFRVVLPQPRYSKSTRSLAKTTSTTSRPPPVVLSSIQVLVRTPAKAKAALVNKFDGHGHEARKAPAGPSTTHDVPTPQPSIGSFHEAKKSRRRGVVAAAPSLTGTTTRLPKHTQPPNYPVPVPFPAPPPYPRASSPPEEDSSPHPDSGRSRSLPRSRNHSSRSALEKVAAAAAPLPALPDHPQLSASAVSRIQAAYKVSDEFGNAVMRQEVRMAIPSPEHMAPVPVPAPRAARHFMSAAELDSHRKAKQREHEARQRTVSKPSFSVELSSGQSRQRATSANSGRGNRDMKWHYSK